MSTTIKNVPIVGTVISAPIEKPTIPGVYALVRNSVITTVAITPLIPFDKWPVVSTVATTTLILTDTPI